jgi:hypothetical protein
LRRMSERGMTCDVGSEGSVIVSKDEGAVGSNMAGRGVSSERGGTLNVAFREVALAEMVEM